MFKNEASLFKNKSPCITKDDRHCSREGHSFTFLDLGFLIETQKEAVRTDKPGNGKSMLRTEIAGSASGQGRSKRALAELCGEPRAGLAGEFRAGVRDAAGAQNQQGAHRAKHLKPLRTS